MSLSLLQSYSSAEEDDEESKSIDESDEESKSIDESDEESKSVKNKSTFDFPDPQQQSDTRSALPSAFDAFSEVTGPPRFLNNAAGEEEIASPEFVDHRRKRNRKMSLPAGVVVEAKAELVGMHERVRSDVEGSKLAATIVETRKPKTEAQNKEMEKKTVKDKEKSKRMRGQSSHATWKSETEMQLRQHFD